MISMRVFNQGLARYILIYLSLAIHFGYRNTQYVSHEKNVISISRLNSLSDTLERSLRDMHEDYTGINKLSERDGRVVAEDVNAENLLSKLVDDVTDILNQKKIALRNIVDTLEEASKDYEWQDELQANFNDSFFMNTTATTHDQTDENLEDVDLGTMNDVLGVKVNSSFSAVHIPVEIYEGYPEIANGLSWSSAVDDIFQENAALDPSIGWQYFSSQKGFTRFYPAVHKWPVPPPYDPVDLFDSRRRPWYIQAASYPKDVIVLVDRSGSLHGQTFTITKFAVETFLDTLGENDFVNVAAFNETTSWVSEIVYEESVNDFGSSQCPVFKEPLIGATNINKKAFLSDIRLLKAKGIANYSDALYFAYNVFKKRIENKESNSNCQKIIALFSDGGTQWPEDALKTIQNDSDTSDVRIFTFAVGPHPTPTAVLKDMACQTGGRHTVITTSSGVRSKIQDSYLDIIAEDLAANQDHTYLYTSAYTSALTNNLTITVTLPVFNMSTALLKQNRSQLLGVAGVDIPVPFLENLVSRETLGPLGHAFMINHNGFLAMHPNIHPQASYLEDALHLDILDVDVSKDTLVEARKNMVLGQQGTISFPGPILIDMEHVFDGEEYKKYTFIPIMDSALTLGLFSLLPSRHLKVLPIRTPVTIDPRTSVLAPWNFCGTHQAMAKPDLLNQRILSSSDRCNQELVNALTWAQDWTNVLVQLWQSSTTDNRRDIITRAVFTRFGLARIVAESSRLNETNSPPSATDFGVEWRDPNKNPALKLGVLRDGLSLFPHSEGAFLSRPARMHEVVAAVVGVNVTSSRLDNIVQGGMLTTGVDSNSTIIMIVDESAFIVSSSRYKDSSGEFLGTKWPMLLEKLVEAGIFNRVNVTNYQAMCLDEDPIRSRVNSAPISLKHPFELVFGFIFNAFSGLCYIWQSITCLLSQGLFSFSLFNPHQTVSGIYKSEPNRDTCIVQHVVYYLTNKKEFSGNLSCLQDSAQVLVRRMNSTNALVVAVDQSLVNFNCDGWRDGPAILLRSSTIDSARMRVVHPKEVACRAPRDRRSIPECEPLASVKTCNGQCSVLVSLFLMVLTSLSSLFWSATSGIH